MFFHFLFISEHLYLKINYTITLISVRVSIKSTLSMKDIYIYYRLDEQTRKTRVNRLRSMDCFLKNRRINVTLHVWRSYFLPIREKIDQLSSAMYDEKNYGDEVIDRRTDTERRIITSGATESKPRHLENQATIYIQPVYTHSLRIFIDTITLFLLP